MNKKINGKVWLSVVGVVMGVAIPFFPHISSEIENVLVSVGELLMSAGLFGEG